MRSSNLRGVGGILGKFRAEVPRSSMRTLSGGGWGVFLVSSYPKSSMRTCISRHYSLPRIRYSVGFWQQNLHTGPSYCITDSLSHKTFVETSTWMLWQTQRSKRTVLEIAKRTENAQRILQKSRPDAYLDIKRHVLLWNAEWWRWLVQHANIMRLDQSGMLKSPTDY